MKTFLVTGATGFLGSHLTRRLHAMGHQLIVVVRNDSDTYRLTSIVKQLHLYHLQKTQIRSQLATIFESNHIDAIIHCATNYGRKGDLVSEIYETNTLLPLYLLELAQAAQVTCFLNTDTTLAPALNSYTLSKFQFKEWGHYFAQKIKFINFKLEHFYGANDDSSKFPNYVVQSCLTKQPRLILTAGEQQRDFIYIEDVVSAYIAVLEQLINIPIGFSEYEIGSGKAISIRQFVELVKRLTESDIYLDFGALPYRAHECMHSCANHSKLLSLGWRPQYDLEAGLIKMIDEYRLE